MVDKWTAKYMKLAKALADDNRACYSRKIGVIIIGPDNEPVSLGYNGSISKAPHNDSAAYLAHLWQNLLTAEQKKYVVEKYNIETPSRPVVRKYFLGGDKGAYSEDCMTVNLESQGQAFVDKFAGCKTCPRRLLDIPSGQGLELCNCAHAERNALANANKSGASTKGATCYCWCAVPCHDCSVQLIQAKIANVHCLSTTLPDYSISSRGLFKMAGVNLHIHDEQDIFDYNGE